MKKITKKTVTPRRRAQLLGELHHPRNPDLLALVAEVFYRRHRASKPWGRPNWVAPTIKVKVEKLAQELEMETRQLKYCLEILRRLELITFISQPRSKKGGWNAAEYRADALVAWMNWKAPKPEAGQPLKTRVTGFGKPRYEANPEAEYHAAQEDEAKDRERVRRALWQPVDFDPEAMTRSFEALKHSLAQDPTEEEARANGARNQAHDADQARLAAEKARGEAKQKALDQALAVQDSTGQAVRRWVLSCLTAIGLTDRMYQLDSAGREVWQAIEPEEVETLLASGLSGERLAQELVGSAIARLGAFEASVTASRQAA